MKYRSDKREAEYVERRAIVGRLLEERPKCEACTILAVYEGKVTYKHRNSKDIHEIKPRSAGGSITDEGNLLALCRPCHTFVTDNPRTAANMGLHLPSWATKEMFEEAVELREAWANGERAVARWTEVD